MRHYIVAAVTAVALAGSAQAATIPAGTASFSFLFNPDVTAGVTTASYNGGGDIYTTAATGGYLAAKGAGKSEGSFNFSVDQGQTVVATLPTFIQFGAFTFNVSSVTTIAYDLVAGSGKDSAISLYMLGSTIADGFDATATSLTLQLNSTGGSAYSVAGTLASPPSGAVPEPASWAMMLGGFGLLGATMRRRKVSLTFS